MSLRIALVALYPAPGARAPGGVRAVVQNLVRGLRAYEDLKLQVVHCHSDITASSTVEEDGVTVHYLAVSGRRVLPNTLTAIGKAGDPSTVPFLKKAAEVPSYRHMIRRASEDALKLIEKK